MSISAKEIRGLKRGESIHRSGIVFKRLANGDGRWSINKMIDGKRIHKVVGLESQGTSYTEVIKLIEQLSTDARHGRFNLPKGRKLPLNFTSVAANYIQILKETNGNDIPKKEQRLKLHLVPFFGSIPIDKIHSYEVERYKKARLKASAAKSTINREIRVLTHLFTIAEEKGWVTNKPKGIKLFKEENTRIDYLRPAEIKKLMEAAEEDSCPVMPLFVKIAYSTGMRHMEILSIRAEDIDFTANRIHIPKAKAGGRNQPITNELSGYLSLWLNAKGITNGFIFKSASSSSGHYTHLTKQFKRVAGKANLGREITPHTLRHTAVSLLVQANVDLLTVQKISGHQTLAMVQRYAHQGDEHVNNAMDKLDSIYSQSA